MYSVHSFIPYTWNEVLGNGFGSSSTAYLWILTNFGLVLDFYGKFLHLPWPFVERIAYFYPFLIFASVFPAILYRKIFQKSSFFILSSAIYLFNTYILMIVGGGQIAGIGMAYSFMPLLFYIFLFWKKSPFILISSLILSIQLLFDLRIFYITFVGLLLLTVFTHENILKSLVQRIVFPLCLVVLLNAFWILPLIRFPVNPLATLGAAYSTTDAVTFFSFAKMENALSLLHPNWPENLFGKASFFRPEFMVFSILAYISLLFVSKENGKRRKILLSFNFLSLIGAFLAKGSNEPFGGIYLWLFQYFPGFQMFRDPTKWYILVAFGYSVLIPYSSWNIYKWVDVNIKKHKNYLGFGKYISKLTIGVIIIFLLFTVRESIFNQLGGAFKTVAVPGEYLKLENFLSNDNSFSRVLWFPTTQRFGFYSKTHPAVSAMSLYNQTSTNGVIERFNGQTTEHLVQNAAIKYVVVPYDSEKEIFLQDRRYDSSQYKKAISILKKVPWIHEIGDFGNIKVFMVANPKPKFWLDGGGRLDYRMINPTKYEILLKMVAKNEDLVFSESFDRNWILKVNENSVDSMRFEEKFNSFKIPKNGSYSVVIEYKPQRYVFLGLIISLITLLVLTTLSLARIFYKE